jgi:hypothetical protein
MSPQKKKPKRRKQTKSRTGFAKAYDYYWKKTSTPFHEANAYGESVVYAKEIIDERETFHGGWKIKKKKSGGFRVEGIGEWDGAVYHIKQKTPLAAAKEHQRQQWNFKKWDKESKKTFSQWMKECYFNTKKGVDYSIKLREEEDYPEEYEF